MTPNRENNTSNERAGKVNVAASPRSNSTGLPEQTLPRPLEHRRRDVESDNPTRRAHERREILGRGAASASHIEDGLARLDRRRFDRECAEGSELCVELRLTLDPGNTARVVPVLRLRTHPTRMPLRWRFGQPW